VIRLAMNCDEGRLLRGPRKLLWFSHLVPYANDGSLAAKFQSIRQLSRTHLSNFVGGG